MRNKIIHDVPSFETFASKIYLWWSAVKRHRLNYVVCVTFWWHCGARRWAQENIVFPLNCQHSLRSSSSQNSWKIKSRLKPGNASCHSIQNRLSSILPLKNLKIKIYRNIILPLFCGCETWSLTLRAERRLRVLENRVLGKIFGPESDEVRGEWWSLHNEELYGLYCLPSIVRVIK